MRWSRAWRSATASARCSARPDRIACAAVLWDQPAGRAHRRRSGRHGVRLESCSIRTSGPTMKRDATKNPSPIPDPFYPLTMPLTVGPGSISVAITLGSQRPRGADWTQLTQYETASIAGIIGIVLSGLFLLPLRAAARSIRRARPARTPSCGFRLSSCFASASRSYGAGGANWLLFTSLRRQSDRRSRHDARDRQCDGHGGAVLQAALQRDAAAMRFGKAADDRQAEARAFLRRFALPRLTEAFEHVSLFVIGDADPSSRTPKDNPPSAASFANNSTVPPVSLNLIALVRRLRMI